MTTIYPVTRGPAHHFFGYYDKCPWSADGRFLLAMQAAFMDRRPGPHDEAIIGLIDLQRDNEFVQLDSSRAWNWQQGAMLQWRPDGSILWNDRREDRFVGVILDPLSGSKRLLSRPVHALSPDGRYALTCDFSRLYDTRPGYGYAGIPDPNAATPAPTNDGIWLIDLESGKDSLILSLADLAARVEPTAGIHWVNHLAFNSDGSRFVLLHRCGVPRFGGGAWWKTWMFTANCDGSDLYCLSDHGMVSHFDWRDRDHLLAWALRRDIGDRFFLFTDRSDEVEVVAGGVLNVDGHCSYSPDRRRLMSDTYPARDGKRALLVFDLEQNRCRELGRFHGPFPADVDLRCDLHARWSRDGRQVCIDSIHEGTRQMYVLDASDHE